MNLFRTANKLQMALVQKGKKVKLNQYQTYSEKSGRMVTKYVLQEIRQTQKGTKKSFTIFESYQMAEVVKYLAKIYEANAETESVC